MGPGNALTWKRTQRSRTIYCSVDGCGARATHAPLLLGVPAGPGVCPPHRREMTDAYGSALPLAAASAAPAAA